MGNENAVQSSTVTVGTTNGLSFSPGIGTFNVGDLAGTSNLVLADTGGSPIGLSVGCDNASTTYGGSLSGTGSLVEAGTGTLVLTGDNTYSGGTTVSSGTLQWAAVLARGRWAAGAVTDNSSLVF